MKEKNDVVKDFLENESILKNSVKNITRYGFSINEAMSIIKRTTNSYENDSFFDLDKPNSDFKSIEFFIRIYSIDNIGKIVEYLIDKGCNNDEITRTLIDAPEILFYANDVDKILLLFKNERYAGYTIPNKDSYRAYSYINEKNLNNDYIYKEQSNANVSFVKEESTIYEKSKKEDNTTNLTNDSYIVNKLISATERPDIKKVLDVSDDESIDSRLNKLKNIGTTRNIHIK